MPEHSTLPEAYFFRPNLGPLERRLTSVIRDLPRHDPATYLGAVADAAAQDSLNQAARPEREIRWAFSISLLADIAAAGGRVDTVDSSARVSWPDWASEDGRAAVRRALLKLRNELPLIKSAAPRDYMPPTMEPKDLSRVMEEGHFSLHEGTEAHPRGATFHQIFHTARQYWTMPDRDREGRNRRFVLVVNHPLLPEATPVGILEASDGAPHEPLRDSLFGLTVETFRRWLSGRTSWARDLDVIEGRLHRLRDALLPIRSVRDRRVETVYNRWRELEVLSAGRSKDSDIFERKRIAYLVRLSRAHFAIKALREGRDPAEGDEYSLVRLFRDLCIPRLHLDISICGALPPFSTALTGKLVIAFFADPRIRRICAVPPGEILRKVFDPDLLAPELPSCGALMLTTKGLYPGHSAQYERALAPGRNEKSLRLRRVGNTRGMTASLLSRRSYALALLLLQRSDNQNAVSRVFGSGGSKRQRRIEAAVQQVGLTDGIVHPYIERPVYALALANNIADVALLNVRPSWLVEPREPIDRYANHAVQLWRTRWLRIATRRLEQTDSPIGGLREWLGSMQDDHESR